MTAMCGNPVDVAMKQSACPKSGEAMASIKLALEETTALIETCRERLQAGFDELQGAIEEPPNDTPDVAYGGMGGGRYADLATSLQRLRRSAVFLELQVGRM